VTTNLEKLRRHVSASKALEPGERDLVDRRVQELETTIEKEPKTSKWKLRARIGPRVKWYQEVQEKSQTY
jgi:hypothetical protein